LLWLTRLHFGRFAGVVTKAVWTAVGLVPATLFVTGVTMWWNRLLAQPLYAVEKISPAERGLILFQPAIE